MAHRSSLLTTFITIFFVSFIIFFHELGHYTACKMFNVPTPTFSIGFGPALIQKKIGETTFQLALVPLGGFVSINTEILNQKSYIQKMIIVLAGIFNNFFLCFIIILLISCAQRKRYSTVIQSITPSSYADQAGLHIGDKIIAFNEIPLINTTEPFFTYLHTHPVDKITLTIERNNKKNLLHYSFSPEQFSSKKIEHLGITLQEETQQKIIIASFIQSIRLMITIMRRWGNISYSNENSNKTGIIGPIGIVSYGSQMLGTGWGIFLFWMALLSTQIGFFNLLPLPFLDGGQAMHFTVQSFAGRQLTPRETTFVNYLMIMMLVGLLLLIAKKKPHHNDAAH